jgi:hypothetical protein
MALGSVAAPLLTYINSVSEGGLEADRSPRR